MTLDPLLNAPVNLKLHVAAIAVALILAPVQLVLPKGTQRHRLVGWVWAAAMAFACLTALSILDRPVRPRFGPLSWLHLVAIFTLVIVWRAVAAARRHDIAGHRAAMVWLSVLALGVPMIFALAVPGRILFRVFTG